MKVKDILSKKGDTVYFVSQTDTVYDALKLMADKNLGSLLVKDQARIAGIFTERDYARKIILHGKTSKETLVEEVMQVKLVTVTEDDSVEECMNIMTNKFLRYLPVFRGDELVGLISIGDVVKAVMTQQQELIESLDSYIAGH